MGDLRQEEGVWAFGDVCFNSDTGLDTWPTIARQEDEDDSGLLAKGLLAILDSSPEGVLHSVLSTSMPCSLWHIVANLTDAHLGTLIQQTVNELLHSHIIN